MEKPISMRIEETRSSIVDIINQSKLHPSIIELMLKEICLESTMLSNKVSQKERMEYFDSQNTTKETNNELEEPTV